MGKSIEVTRQEHTPSDLRRLAGKTEDGGQVRRLLGLALVLEGRARGEAAAANGMDRQILCDWVHRYNAAGVAGLATGTRPGRPPSLNEAQMAELKELVIKGPDPELHKVVRWRCVDLCEEIARRYSVRVTKGTMGKWLRSLPPYSPELNAMENVWHYLRANQLSLLVWDSYEAIVAACKEAWDFLVGDPDRIKSIGVSLLACVGT